MTTLTEGIDLFAEAREEPAPEPVAESLPALLGEPSDADLRITAKRFVLQAACEKASKVVPSKDTMPVLKNLRVVADTGTNGAGRIRVQATDLELSVIATTTLVNVERQGTAVFPAKKFLEIIKESADEDVVIDVQDGVATITNGPRRNWTLRLQAAKDYPVLPEVAELEMHTYDRVKLLGAIQAVKDAAAGLGDTRANLMMLDLTDGKMTAADGVRFQQAELADFPLNIQIPIGAVDDLVSLLRTTDLQNIEVGEAPSHLAFRVGTDVFIANKLMADFPDVEAMLLRPALANDQELTVDRQELYDAIKRVRINADPDSSAVALRITKNRIVVEARDKLGNAAIEEIEAGWSRPDRDIVVNHKFFTEMLGMYDGRSCLFLLGTDTKSRKSMVLLRDTAQGTTGIIQQMRADWLGQQ